MNLLIIFSQVGHGGNISISWGIGDIAIAIVVIAAVVALVYVALRQFGVTIPPWVQQAFWIVVVAFSIIFCIKLLLGM